MSEKESEDKKFATVNPSGDKKGKEITLEEVLPYLRQNFLLKSPFIWLVGGLVIHGKTEGDIDILIRLPEDISDSIRTPLEFRLYRQFPDHLRERVHFLYDLYHGPFTDAIEIADLKVEMKREPQKVEMSLDKELFERSHNDIREKLAEYAHTAWSGWMKYLFKKCQENEDGTATIPVELVKRWKRQMNTPYSDLPENEKESDRAEADKMIAIQDSKIEEETSKQRTIPGQKQTYNSPTFAYFAVYGKVPEEFLSGRTDHPQRTWNGISVDKPLKNAWLEALNGIEGAEIRASCQGHSPERVSYVVFRTKDSEHDKKKAKEISKRLNTIEGCYSLADVGEAGKMRIVVAGKVWFGEAEWENWWEKLAGRIEGAVRSEKDKTSKNITNELSEECIEGFLCERITEEEFQRLHLEEFRSEGIDEDLRNPVKNFPLLLADLRYLGNSGFPRLKAGESWGEWTLDDVLRYFAKITDTLRSKTSLPLLDTDKDGNKKNDSSWWKCYRESKKYMKIEPPSHDEAKEWNDRRRKLFEKPGEKKELSLESDQIEEGNLVEELSLVEEIREALDSEEEFPKEFREKAESFLFSEEMLKTEVFSIQAVIDHLAKLHEKGIR